MTKVFACVITILLLSWMPDFSGAKNREKLTIKLVAPDKLAAKVTGYGDWKIYLQGPIDQGATSRLLREITTRKIKEASVYLHSPGGNLLEGIELGRLIRKFSFSTYVGRGGSEKLAHSPGECYSACVLGYIGGYYRYDDPHSKIGVHRFYSASTTSADMDVAQILSAAITNHLTGMGVDIGLFDRMSKAGKNELYLLSKDELRKLKVVNNGTLPAKWTIETLDGHFYLKGEQRGWTGGGKVLFTCPNRGQVIFMAVYGPVSNAETLLSTTVRYSIRFDNDDFVPLGSPVERPRINNDFILTTFNLTPDHIRRLSTAASIGWAGQPHNPDIFYGFVVDATDGTERIKGFLKSCESTGR